MEPSGRRASGASYMESRGPWTTVEAMRLAYQRRLALGVPQHVLFHYQSHAQYVAKLASYSNRLQSLGHSVGRLLDVGCGSGELLRYYEPLEGYLGIDVVPEFIDYARTRFPDYSFQCADILRTSVEERFDTVVMVGLLGRSPHPFQLVSTAARLARSHLVFDFLGDEGSAHAVAHLRTLSRHRVLKVVRDVGLRVVEEAQLGTSTRIVTASQ